MNSQQRLRSVRKFCKELAAEFPEAKITEHRAGKNKTGRYMTSHAGVELGKFQIIVMPCAHVMGVFCEIYANPAYVKIGNNYVSVGVAQLKSTLKKYL